MFATSASKLLVSLGLLVALATTCIAQPVDPSSCLPDARLEKLAGILETALKQSPQMLQRNIDLARADAGLIAANAARLPQIGGNVRYGVESVSTRNASNDINNGFFYNIGLSQSLYNWGEIRSNIEISELELKIRQKSWQEAYRELASTLRAQYLSLIMQKRTMAARLVALEQLKRARANDEERHAAGLLGDAEFHQGALRLEEAVFEYERQVFEFSQSRRVFARLAGLPEFAESEIPDDIPAPVLSESQAERMLAWFDQAGLENELPSVQSMQFLKRQSELRYQVAKVRLLPKFSLYLNDSIENNTYLSGNAVSQGSTHRDSIGISASWTIFDGYMTRAAKRQALADGRDAELKLKGALRGLNDQKKTLVTRFSFATRSLSFAERRLAMSKGALGYMEGECSAGRQPQTALDAARAAYQSSLYAVLGARADVYARWSDLMGLLWLDPLLQKLPNHLKNHGN